MPTKDVGEIDLLRRVQYPLTCGHCGYQFSLSIGELETQSQYACPGCRTLWVGDPSQIREQMKALEQPVR